MISNCAIAALAAWIRHPFEVRIHSCRSRMRFVRHFYWSYKGRLLHFIPCDITNKSLLFKGYVTRLR